MNPGRFDMARREDDAIVDAHAHVVRPGLPGLHAFPAALDGAVAAVAAAVRAGMTASGTAQTLAMGTLSDDPADLLGVAKMLRIADRVPDPRAIGVADPRRSDPEHLDRVERQLQAGRVKGLKAYLATCTTIRPARATRRTIDWPPATKSPSSSTLATPARPRPSSSTPIPCRSTRRRSTIPRRVS